MKLRIVLLFPALLIFLLVLALACSQGKDSPLMPDLIGDVESGDIEREPEDMFVGGLWEVAIDKNTKEVNILQLRSADKAMNVLGFLEPPAMFFLSINISTLEVDPAEGRVGAHVILNHPLYSAAGQFDGFDVRGIVFGPEIRNADGYTPLIRPKDFKGIPFGYIDGMLGVPDEWASFDGDYYPYKYFADGLSATEELADFFGNPGNLSNRGIFSEGATNVRHYEMYFDVDAGQFLVFNYAILVSFDFPEGDPPYELDDYPLWTANCAEPFFIDASVVHNSLFYNSEDGGGGRLSIDVEVFDWQGLGNVEVTIEAPDVIAPTVATNYIPGSTTKSGVFSFEDIEGLPQADGELELIITAADTGTTFGDSFFFDFIPESHPLHNEPAYTIIKHTLMVTDNPAPWVGPVAGDLIIDVGSVYEYQVEVESFLYPDGPFTYQWESGNDFPPLYNDGDGGNDGSDTFIYDTPGEYTIDVRVAGPGGAQSTSVGPMTIIAVVRPGPVGDLTLDVNRNPDNSISTNNNISLDWDAVAGAVSYAIYYDPDPMDGDFTVTEFAGETTETEFDFTLQPDAAAFFRVRARAIVGEQGSEGPNSQGAFVDFEQAEYEASVGSWEGNSVYDNPELQVTRSSNGAHRLSGDYGWADSLGSSSDYHNSYEVFYSDAYPEVQDAETFVFEVAHRVYNYCYYSDREDGYSMGYLISGNPPVGLGPDNFLYYIVLTPSVGPPYWQNNDSQRDEFTYSLNPDAGYTYSYDWRLSTFNASQLQWDFYDRVAIGHSTDTGTLNGGFFAVDDIAVIIY
jgi:hypothetical protein